jgi:hypothetical protein
MIYCSNCGKELPVDSKFCPSCGATINATAHTTEPVRRTEPVSESVRTEPVRTERVIEPTRTNKVVTEPVDRKDLVTRRTINEFYKDAGFWGGLLLIAGFFLPFFSNNTGSLFDAVQAEASTDKIVLLWLIFPVAGLFMLLHSLRVLPGFVAIFFTFFALIALIYWGYIMISNREKYFGATEAFAIMKTVGIGLWATLLGTILLLFHRQHTLVQVNRTKYVDSTV